MADFDIDVYPRTNPSGTVVWIVRWFDPDPNAKVKRPQRTRSTESAARRYAREIRNELRAGLRPGVDEDSDATPPLTFQRYIEDHWWSDKLKTTREKRRITPGTQRDYKDRLRLRLMPHFGPMLMTEITAPVIKSYLGTRRGAGQSESYLNGDWRLLVQIFEYAWADDFIKENPTKRVMREFKPVADPPEKEWLRQEELPDLLARVSARGNQLQRCRNKLITMFAVIGGMRASEIIPIHISDIVLPDDGDPESDGVGWLGLRRVKTQDDEEPRDVTKNGDPLRIIPLPPVLVTAIRDYLAERRRQPVIHAALFVTSTGEYLNYHNWARCNYMKHARAVRPGLDFHGLRHAANTWYDKETASKVAQMIIGHKSKKMHDLYTHEDIEDMRKAALKLQASLESVLSAA